MPFPLKLHWLLILFVIKLLDCMQLPLFIWVTNLLCSCISYYPTRVNILYVNISASIRVHCIFVYNVYNKI